MLAYQWQSESGIPVVFLHGLLGSREDWREVFSILQNFPDIRPLAIDLPCHNQSQAIFCNNFEDVRTLLEHTLRHCIGQQPFYLVGYSLGGRIALDYAAYAQDPFLRGVILEGANIGLKTEQERLQRWQNDQKWANRFSTEPIERVLNDWYQQPVFADLTFSQRINFISQRRKNEGKYIAQILLATSLAKQADFQLWLNQINQVNKDFVLFLIGEKDQKFRQMVEKYRLCYHLIEQAGHNTHKMNPTAFVQALIRNINRGNDGSCSLPRMS